MSKTVLTVLLSLALLSFTANTKGVVNSSWWKDAVIYKVYLRSFKDNNNDGVGDIAGLVSKLPYLKDLGITAIWLPPIFKQTAPPKVDFGYEITNYLQIHEEYGDLVSFGNLVREARGLGIKVLLEMVLNHVSVEHYWFLDARYKDYFVWQPSKTRFSGNPPNNWVSHYNQSAWTYSQQRSLYYLHQFAEEQADLNFYNKSVSSEIREILVRWIAEGADGFIINDVPFLVEDEKYEDEATLEKQSLTYDSLDHLYTANQERSYDILYQWRSIIEEANLLDIKDERILITRADTELNSAMRYCGEGGRKGAHFTYNYLFSKELTRLNAQNVYDLVEMWYSHMPEDCQVNWALGHHDVHRVATRFGPHLVDALNILLAFLPGVMITYNGEEIGMENGEVSFGQCQDPLGCSSRETFETSRDFQRTPFHWDDSINAGFNVGAKTWLPVSKKHVENNVEEQTRPGYPSHLKVYKELIKLRKKKGFTSAQIKFKVVSDDVLVMVKEIDQDNVYAAVINFAENKIEVNLSDIPGFTKYSKVVIAGVSSQHYERVLATDCIYLDGYDSLIVKILPDTKQGSQDWWNQTFLYQIYPLSFKDSDNDGYGDLQGIMSKLDHLQAMKVGAVCLSSIYESAHFDDVTNFKAIDPLFGTLSDFKQLLNKLHERGIRLILDFIPNHTSVNHEWFLKSEKREEGFEDFYVWRDAKGSGPPNNWVSVFKGSAWKKSGIRNQYYLHQFGEEHPDLNFRNPLVVKEMKDVLKFWLDLGVDGFRISSASYIFENADFKSEPYSNDPNSKPDDYESLHHIYTTNQEETYNMVYKWREFMDDYVKEHGGDARILIVEAYGDTKDAIKYYGDPHIRNGCHLSLNFQLIRQINKDSSVKQIKSVIEEWINNVDESFIDNWMLGSADHHRVATRLGTEKVDGFNMIIGILPGVMVAYSGEEIGMENGKVTWEQGRDPSACQGNPENFHKVSRDFERTPFHWDGSVNAGFNNGTKTWLPVSETYSETNLASQNHNHTHYKVFENVMALREWFSFLPCFEIATSGEVLLIQRKADENNFAMLIFNTGSEEEAVNVTEVLNVNLTKMEVVSMSVHSGYSIGEMVNMEEVFLRSYESIVLAVKEDDGGSGGPGGQSAVSDSSIVLCPTVVLWLLFRSH